MDRPSAAKIAETGCGGYEEQGEVQNPVGTMREPMGVEISDEERGLEEDETGDPYGC